MAGECDLAVANTYYMGLMLNNEKEPEQKEWAKAARSCFPLRLTWAPTSTFPACLLTKNAPNKDNALKLMEYLASDERPAALCEWKFRISGKS